MASTEQKDDRESVEGQKSIFNSYLERSGIDPQTEAAQKIRVI